VTSSSVLNPMLAGRGAGRVTFGLRGAFEGSALGALHEAVEDAIEPGMDLIVDMSEVTAIGAEGLAVLDGLAALARADGGSFLVRPPENKTLSAAVAAVTAAPVDLARLEHPSNRAD
jgi:hypothetical protein